ncbi:MAG: hypothetical protein IJI47_00850 [Eubacterium sp.]|nr:hypothetical protein [Eubacterium sp.]
MSISFKGYENKTITFEAAEGLTAGAPVTVDANGKAANASADGYFVGVCTAIRNGWASVQTEGYVEVPYTGTAPSHGLVSLVAAGESKVKAGGDGDIALYKVIKVDTENTTVGFIL